MTYKEIARKLKQANENIHLIYAFNGTGKTCLSVAYKDISRDINGNQTGVYYNAYSEDLFVWNNDEVKLTIVNSSLHLFHQYINEDSIRLKLAAYQPTYEFRFKWINDDIEKGLEYIWFFKEDNPKKFIKISRGEERIFVWCFFLALFDIDEWAGKQNAYFFIDDPVSSLDDNNIFITASLIFELMKANIDQRKIIITTHHMGIYSILCDWLSKGENASKFKTKKYSKKGQEYEENKYSSYFLERIDGTLKLIGKKKGIILYHLLLLQELKNDIDQHRIGLHSFVQIRQVLECVSSFLGKSRFSALLELLNLENSSLVADTINIRSHQRIFRIQGDELNDSEKGIIQLVVEKLIGTFKFDINY